MLDNHFDYYDTCFNCIYCKNNVKNNTNYLAKHIIKHNADNPLYDSIRLPYCDHIYNVFDYYDEILPNDFENILTYNTYTELYNWYKKHPTEASKILLLQCVTIK